MPFANIVFLEFLPAKYNGNYPCIVALWYGVNGIISKCFGAILPFGLPLGLSTSY